MPVKYVIAYLIVLSLGVALGTLINRIREESKKSIKAGFLLIKKDNEAIDGQVRITKNLWEISENQEAILKIKILPGEPGDWEEKKNG